MSENQHVDRWRSLATQLYLTFAALEGLFALILFLRLPADPDQAWLGGYSIERLVGVVVLFVGFAAFGYLAVQFARSPTWCGRFLSRLSRFVQSGWVYYAILLFALVLGVISSHIVWLASVITDPFYHAIVARLAPPALWIAFLSWQTLFYLPLLRFGKPHFDKNSKLLRTSALVLLALLLFWGFVAITRIGIEPDIGGWDPPGAPVLIRQVWLAWGLGIMFLITQTALMTGRGEEYDHRLKWLDIGISILLWAAAFWVWTQTPMSPSYFAPQPRAPNFEYYPYSDAAYYDLAAQRLLIGEGFSGIPMKPLYAMILALFHTLVGQDYVDVVTLQIAVLALLPVAAYWLTKSLHVRLSGLVFAVLLIARERNAIMLSSDIRVSHSKLLMSGMPVTLVIVLLTWLLIRWLQKPGQRRWYPLAIGGILGLLMLIRPQILILALAIGAIIAIFSLRRFRSVLINAGFFVLGLSLALTPWLWRSYETTGRVTLNSPEQMAYLTKLYSLEPWTYTVERNPGESDGDYAQRVNDHLFGFIRTHPGEVSKFVSAHFIHNEVAMLLALPMSPWFVQNPNSALNMYGWGQSPRFWDTCCSVQAYVTEMNFWGGRWEGALSVQMIAMLLVNLTLIAIGLGAAWRRQDIAGWLPLALSLVYSISTAVGRYSGWRLILPADWVVFMYYAIGIGQISLWGCAYGTGKSLLTPVTDSGKTTWKRFSHSMRLTARDVRLALVWGLVFLALGLSPLLIENGIQPRFAPLTAAEQVEILQQVTTAGENPQALERFRQDERAVVLQGLAFYPRYLDEGQGEPGGDWAAYAPRDYARLGFTLIGPQQAQVIVRMESDSPPERFPNAAEVFVIGCKAADFVDAAAVIVQDESQSFMVRNPDAGLGCPLPPP